MQRLRTCIGDSWRRQALVEALERGLSQIHPSSSYVCSATNTPARQPAPCTAVSISQQGLAESYQRQARRGIIVPVNGLAVDRAVKQLQRKLNAEGLQKALRARETYVKPCHQRLLARKESAVRHQKRMFKYKMNWAMWRRGQ